MSFTIRTQQGYTCARCGAFKEAKSPFVGDRPDGYYIRAARAKTSQHRNNPIRSFFRLQDDVYLCNKDCIAAWVQFEMNGQLEKNPFRPIGE